MEKRWEIKKADCSLIKDLAKELNVSEIVSHLLVLRGITTFQDAKLFFRPEMGTGSGWWRGLDFS